MNRGLLITSLVSGFISMTLMAGCGGQPPVSPKTSQKDRLVGEKDVRLQLAAKRMEQCEAEDSRNLDSAVCALKRTGDLSPDATAIISEVRALRTKRWKIAGTEWYSRIVEDYGRRAARPESPSRLPFESDRMTPDGINGNNPANEEALEALQAQRLYLRRQQLERDVALDIYDKALRTFAAVANKEPKIQSFYRSTIIDSFSPPTIENAARALAWSMAEAGDDTAIRYFQWGEDDMADAYLSAQQSVMDTQQSLRELRAYIAMHQEAKSPLLDKSEQVSASLKATQAKIAVLESHLREIEEAQARVRDGNKSLDQQRDALRELLERVEHATKSADR